MLHQNAVLHEMDYAEKHKASLGVVNFFIYTFIYAGFVFLGLFYPELLGAEIIGGQNLAFVYGLGLIILAIVMGFIYNYQCVKLENKMNVKQPQK